MSEIDLPVAIIGAGPVGLASALRLSRLGETPVVLEAGRQAGFSIEQWSHVRLFSPWSFNIDPVAGRSLADTGWQPPHPNYLPTGAEFLEQYLLPLAGLPELSRAIRTGTRVVAVTRAGFDRAATTDAGRETAPFLLQLQTAQGEEELAAKAVIDASGTYWQPNPLGAGGVPALGERKLADHIFYGIPDVLDRWRDRYSGRRVLVAGSGHSAINVLLDLAVLAPSGTNIYWVVRRPRIEQLLVPPHATGLLARSNLAYRLGRLVEEAIIKPVTGFRVASVEKTPNGLIVNNGQTWLQPVDEIIAATGFRPDLSLHRELRLEMDAVLECPAGLAPLINPQQQTCATVPLHGVEKLKHPLEPNFYIVGMKSYGRAPTFLMQTGYEQIRAVVNAITGKTDPTYRTSLTFISPQKLKTAGTYQQPDNLKIGAHSAAQQNKPGACTNHPSIEKIESSKINHLN